MIISIIPFNNIWFPAFVHFIAWVTNCIRSYGISHKTDDFNFEVISSLFTDSNVHFMLGYKTFHSELMRFYRLCNNKTDSLLRAKLIYHKLINRGYENNLLCKSFMIFCLCYQINAKYVELRYRCLFSKMLTFDNHVTCDMHSTDIDNIIKPCLVIIYKVAKFPSYKKNNSIPLSLKALEVKRSTCVGNSSKHNLS